ncbi:MAG: hypothetical protein AMXMBFR82_06980 [Candidatus Hydrogenedentota bacterium]
MAKSYKESSLSLAKASPSKPLASATLADGGLLETLYDPIEKRTSFCLAREGKWKTASEIVIDRQKFVPYSPENNLIQHGTVLFPSAVEEYGTEAELVQDIREFIRRYVDLSPLFEEVAAYYVLFTWLYDSFNELPYLRAMGDYGSGKTRFLLTVGSICYLPIFASGASTVSPLFRILDAFRGTLIIDEADLRWSDERADMVKILNNGNARGFPVLRTELTPTRELNPVAYSVFGPKLVATRAEFSDKALESRFLTERMGVRPLRADIPINLPKSLWQEARNLRNKLLAFRIRNHSLVRPLEGVADANLEPRLNQIFSPLLSVIQEPEARDKIRSLIRQYNRQVISERGMTAEAQVLEVMRALLNANEPLSVKVITERFANLHEAEYQRKITPRWIGWLIRQRLGFSTNKTNGTFVVSNLDPEVLERLEAKYGLKSLD